MDIFDGKNVRKATQAELSEILDAQKKAQDTLQPYALDKFDIVTRMTKPEADNVFAAMSGMPGQLQLVWQTAQTVRSDSEFFDDLKEFLKQVIGEARAVAVLAQ